jgi:chromosomal replication initiator protein
MSALGSGQDWPSIWNKTSGRLLRMLGNNDVFKVAIQPLTIESFDHGELKLRAPTQLDCQNALAHVKSIANAFGIEYIKPQHVSIEPSKPVTETPKDEPHPPEKTSEVELWQRLLHPQQSFDTFITDETNVAGMQVIHAFLDCKSVHDQVLYLYGENGCGKTHLLHACSLELQRFGKKVLCLRANDFMQHSLEGYAQRGKYDLKHKMLDVDVVVVDDVHCIGCTMAAWAKFRSIIAWLGDAHHRLIVSADHVPSALTAFDSETRSCLAGGYVVDVVKPKSVARQKILKRRAIEFATLRPHAKYDDAALERIAELSNVSVRESLSMLNKLLMCADLTHTPVTPAVVEKMISRRPVSSDTSLSIETIQCVVAGHYHLDIKHLSFEGRARRYARPRQVAMYLARLLTSLSLPEIGKQFGGRDHTTVLHACRKIEAIMQVDVDFKAEVEFLRDSLSQSPAA